MLTEWRRREETMWEIEVLLARGVRMAGGVRMERYEDGEVWRIFKCL
jgi:hypothetical protein